MNDLRQLSSAFLAGRTALLAYVRGLVRDHDAAEDLFQEVYLKMAKAAERGVKIEDVGRWCRGVAKNLALHYWRKQRADLVVINSEIVDLVGLAFEENHNRIVELNRRREALARCLEKLTPPVRRMLQLRYGGGRPVKAIAELMKRKINSVLVVLHRARKALLDCIERGVQTA